MHPRASELATSKILPAFAAMELSDYGDPVGRVIVRSTGRDGGDSSATHIDFLFSGLIIEAATGHAPDAEWGGGELTSHLQLLAHGDMEMASLESLFRKAADALATAQTCDRRG